MRDPAKYEPTLRFGSRVADYASARPGYPRALTEWLLREAALSTSAVVADLGSGTGLFTRELLAAGLRVHAVEPNGPMRAEAERTFAGWPGFMSADGVAEATGLPGASVQLITAAQAYHWFVPEKTRAEALRILAPGGYAALIWNVRRIASSFAQDYETLLMSHCPDYASGQPRQASAEKMSLFFGGMTPRQARFDYVQRFDYEGLKRRLLSSSYTPGPNDSARKDLIRSLAALFDRYQENGQILFEYDTTGYIAQLKSLGAAAVD